MPSTGHGCLQPGDYRNECHGKEILLERGDRFPPCDECHQRAKWTLSVVLHTIQTPSPPRQPA